MQDAGPLAQMKGVFGAEKQHVENRHISLVPPYSLKALNTIYPLTVASKSTTTARHNAANKILKNMCEHSNTLVQQAMMVSPGRLEAPSRGLE